MALSHTCDACKKPIVQTQYAEITINVKLVSSTEEHSPVEAMMGDYCRDCVQTGMAVVDLRSGFDYGTKIKDAL